ncbi:DMT family transporter [Nonomuraea sp. LPB2021202275-12-8]|uniref:DMT family transporter n=1 Tax=Nonomuraea sp. LPB2021202275-12-8 TaxID=3120159 RepID=UPI00300C4211
MAVVPAPRPLTGVVLLLFVSAAWGSAFPLMKDLILRLPVEDLLAERYTIAALTLLLIRPGCLRGLSRGMWINGLILGVMFGVGQAAQAVALDSLPAPVSGFAVGTSVVMTPIMALVLFQVRVPGRVWGGVLLALAGMTVFTLLRGVEDNAFSMLALGVTLSAAALYSGHTLLLARMSRKSEGFNAYALTVIQLGAIGLLTGVLAVHDGITLPASGPDWAVLAHLSVVSCALGFLARAYAQMHVRAVPSAVLMSTQPFWVAAIAVIWFGEQVGWSMLVGGGLMAAAMLLAVPSRTEALDEPDPRRRQLLVVSRRASHVLGELKIKREDPLKLSGPVAPVIPKTSCAPTEGCPWNAHSVKGSREPSLERLIERASHIVRAKNTSPPDWCQSMTLLGRCLCDLMGESEKTRSAARLPCWFRSQ